MSAYSKQSEYGTGTSNYFVFLIDKRPIIQESEEAFIRSQMKETFCQDNKIPEI